MTLNIKEFVPVLSQVVIKQRVNVRYKQLLGAENWEFVKDSTTVKLVGIHSSVTGETVAMTTGETLVTGTATTFTNFAAGDFIRFGSESQPYIVSTVNSATSITLETTYGGTTDTDSTYTMKRTIYTPSVGNVGEITSIVYQNPLGEVSEGFLNALDPERSSTGQPQYYRIFSKSKADGLVTFEVWPTPDQDYVVTVFYKKYISDMTEDTDEPVFRPELIEAGALWDCYRMAFAITQNPAWIGLARDAKTDFGVLLRDSIIEDISTSSVSTVVRDVMSAKVWDNNFMASHDVEGVL